MLSKEVQAVRHCANPGHVTVPALESSCLVQVKEKYQTWAYFELLLHVNCELVAKCFGSALTTCIQAMLWCFSLHMWLRALSCSVV